MFGLTNIRWVDPMGILQGSPTYQQNHSGNTGSMSTPQQNTSYANYGNSISNNPYGNYGNYGNTNYHQSANPSGSIISAVSDWSKSELAKWKPFSNKLSLEEINNINANRNSNKYSLNLDYLNNLFDSGNGNNNYSYNVNSGITNNAVNNLLPEDAQAKSGLMPLTGSRSRSKKVWGL